MVALITSRLSKNKGCGHTVGRRRNGERARCSAPRRTGSRGAASEQPVRHVGPFSWVLIAVLIAAIGAEPAAAELLFGTGPAGSFSHFAGRAICREINRADADISCRVVAAPGDTHNLTNLQQGSLDLALVDSKPLYDATHQSGAFEFINIRYDNIGVLLPLYDVPMLIIARRSAGIRTLDQVAGRRINAGAPRSEAHFAMDLIMGAKGWQRDDFKVFQELPAAQSQDTMAFCHGDVDAMAHVGVHPDVRLRQLMALCSAAAVSTLDEDLAAVVRREPAYTAVTIPADAYAAGNPALDAIGTTVVLVASLGVDDADIRAVLSVLAANQRQLRLIHPALSGFSADPAGARDVGVPRHPGAMP